ncbi:MAG: hypothetical protein Q9166_000689 [cf. Caloplaca sp. 2 TL-2023]
MSAIERPVEPQGERHVFLAACYLHRWIRKLCAEHYLGIIIASMPALKPIFSKVLDSTRSSSSGSKRSFQKIRSPGGGIHVPSSYATSGRSSIQRDYIKKTTEFRVSSQLELEVNRDYELANVSPGQTAGFLRHSGNSWARDPRMEQEQGAGASVGGYRHIDEAFHPGAVPQASVRAPSVRVPR